MLNLPAEVQTIPALTSDRPLPPVGAADLQAVMDRDLADALKSGVLAPGAGGGIAIGVYSAASGACSRMARRRRSRCSKRDR